MTGEIQAIEGVIRIYLDGLYEGDTAKLARVFDEACHLYSVGDGDKLADVPRKAWLEMVAGRPSGKARDLKRTDRIVSIDLSGPETAFVKLECSLHPSYFTDYLTLLKLDGRWRIVSKTFRTDVRD